MASFLVTCPQCRAMIARDMPCPDCGTSSASTADGPIDDGLQREFQRREGNHKRNYAVFMALMLTTAFVSLVTAIMWFRFIFHGNVIAFFWIILLSLLSAALGVGLKLAKNLFPLNLNCPSCQVRLDQLGLPGTDCPACSARLRS